MIGLVGLRGEITLKQVQTLYPLPFVTFEHGKRHHLCSIEILTGYGMFWSLVL